MGPKTLGVERAGGPILFAGLAALAAVLLSALVLSAGAGAIHAGGMDAMSIDLDVTGNTATSLGGRDDCVEVSPGQPVTIDVTAEGIPASNPMIAFGFDLNFQQGVVVVESENPNFLLGATAGSAVFDASDPLPDGDGAWSAAAADTGGAPTAEGGSGVLQRIGLTIDAAAPPGVYTMTLSFAVHLDPANAANLPDVLRPASLAVNSACPGTPTPEPSGTALPTPCTCDPAPVSPSPTPRALPDTGDDPGALPAAGGVAVPLSSEPDDRSGVPIELLVALGALSVAVGLVAISYLWRHRRRRP